MVCKVSLQKTKIFTFLILKVLCAHFQSGTPLGRGELEDLVNIFAFIQQEPFASMNWKALARSNSISGRTFLSMIKKMLCTLTLRRTHQVVESELGN